MPVNELKMVEAGVKISVAVGTVNESGVTGEANLLRDTYTTLPTNRAGGGGQESNLPALAFEASRPPRAFPPISTI